MNWIWGAYLMVGSACATLAIVQAYVWLLQRRTGFNLNAAFALMAMAVAMLAAVELAMLSADSVEAWTMALWWLHYPVLAVMVAVVLFFQLQSGGGWTSVGWVAVGLRALVAFLNLFTTPNVVFRDVTAIETVLLLGYPVTVGVGVPSPWMAVAHASLVLLLVFLIQRLWAARHQERRLWVLLVGAGMLVFVAGGVASAIISFWGIVRVPTFGTLLFLPILIMMGYLLSIDRIRVPQLAGELSVKSEALEGSERQLALATQVAKAGIFSIDLKTGALWATSQTLRMFGLDPAGRHSREALLECIHPEDRPRMQAFLHAAHNVGHLQRLEYRLALPSGEQHWHNVQGSVHTGSAGSDRLMGAIIDVTERKQIESEATRQRIELEHLSRVATLNELSTTLAHELNQPLSIIMSNAEAAQQLLRRPDIDVAELVVIIDDIIVADEHAGAMIQRLRRMLSRGESVPNVVKVDELVASVLQLMRSELAHRHVRVDLNREANDGTALADRVALEQVLVNLITNACDAMIEVAPADRVLTITTARDGDWVVIHVADVGAGLGAEPTRLFEAFYTTKQDGLGMGLSISKSIMANHGGRLEANDNQPRGAVFSMYLPAASEGA